MVPNSTSPQPSEGMWRKPVALLRGPSLPSGGARYLITLAIVASLKALGALWVHSELSRGERGFWTPWMAAWGAEGPSARWLYLFLAWDTGWYVKMARTLALYPDRPFFPAYPWLIRALSGILGDYWLSACAISFGLGMACAPVYQALAERYMAKEEAFGSALLFALFPFTFLFTAISYAEPLFLLATLASWHLNLSGRFSLSLALASLAALSRPLGISSRPWPMGW